jgi:serine/threonine protein kinase
LGSVYGNLPYIAPEVLFKGEYTFKSDIYSIAIIMWELSAERPPFNNSLHNYDLVMSIINGIRPQIISGTPSEYRELMKQCWDADPEKRPDIVTLWNKVEEINNSLHINSKYWNNTNSPLNENFNRDSIVESSLIEDPRSKLFSFSNLPNPKNATEGEMLKKNYYYYYH